MSDTNVGMGMAPHRKGCRCLECECDKWARAYRDAKQESQSLQQQLDACKAENARLRKLMRAVAEAIDAMQAYLEVSDD